MENSGDEIINDNIITNLNHRLNVLSFSERQRLQELLGGSQTLRSIAVILGRSATAIHREIKRNGGRRDYDAFVAQNLANFRMSRGFGHGPIKAEPLSEKHVEFAKQKMGEDWTHDQIRTALGFGVARYRRFARKFFPDYRSRAPYKPTGLHGLTSIENRMSDLEQKVEILMEQINILSSVIKQSQQKET